MEGLQTFHLSSTCYSLKSNSTYSCTMFTGENDFNGDIFKSICTLFYIFPVKVFFVLLKRYSLQAIIYSIKSVFTISSSAKLYTIYTHPFSSSCHHWNNYFTSWQLFMSANERKFVNQLEEEVVRAFKHSTLTVM